MGKGKQSPESIWAEKRREDERGIWSVQFSGGGGWRRQSVFSEGCSLHFINVQSVPPRVCVKGRGVLVDHWCCICICLYSTVIEDAMRCDAPCLEQYLGLLCASKPLCSRGELPYGKHLGSQTHIVVIWGQNARIWDPGPGRICLPLAPEYQVQKVVVSFTVEEGLPQCQPPPSPFTLFYVRRLATYC